MPRNQPNRTDEDSNTYTVVFNDETELEDVQSYGITGNTSSPAISSRLSNNSSSPMNQGMVSDNSSSANVRGRQSNNSSSPAITGEQNEAEVAAERDDYTPDDETIGETETYEDYGEEGVDEEEQLGQIRVGRDDEGNLVVQSISAPGTELGREEAERFAQSLVEQLENGQDPENI